MLTANRQLRLLVRYSADVRDVALAEELLRHLDVLKRFAGVDVWSEARIRPGDENKQEIQRAIDEADVALLLLSADFLASDALLTVDVPQLQRRHASGKLRVIPVLLRSCLWKVHPWLKELHPLPKGGKAIGAVSGGDRDAVLTEVVKAIIELIAPSMASSEAGRDSEAAGEKGDSATTSQTTGGGAIYNVNIHGSTIGAVAWGKDARATGALGPPERASAHSNSRPVLAVQYDRKRGWLLRNIGGAAAVRAVVTYSAAGQTWERPVRITPLAPGEEQTIHWLGHTNVQKIGVRYEDTSDRCYSTVCEHDECKYTDGDVFPAWREEEILRHWSV